MYKFQMAGAYPSGPLHRVSPMPYLKIFDYGKNTCQEQTMLFNCTGFIDEEIPFQNICAWHPTQVVQFTVSYGLVIGLVRKY